MATNKCTRCNRPLKNQTSVINGMGPICAGKAARKTAERAGAPRSTFSVHRVDSAQRIVWIVDQNCGMSVTNDADRVVASVHAQYPGFRIIYRDTMGRWDELQHVAGVFSGYAPAANMAPDLFRGVVAS